MRYVLLPHRIKIYAEFDLMTSPMMATFTGLFISEFWFFKIFNNISLINFKQKISLQEFKFNEFAIHKT